MTRRQLAILAFALAVATAVVLVCLPAWFWHPLGTQVCRATYKGSPQAVRDCMSYNFHSGIEANVPLVGQFVALCVVIAGFWHRHNCHEKGCLWPVRHGKTHCPKHEKAA